MVSSLSSNTWSSAVFVWFCDLAVIFDLLNPSDDVCGEEDHEDTEYNFMAEDQKEEKEEYRNDRAVRIPRKFLSSSPNLNWLFPSDYLNTK